VVRWLHGLVQQQGHTNMIRRRRDGLTNSLLVHQQFKWKDYHPYVHHNACQTTQCHHISWETFIDSIWTLWQLPPSIDPICIESMQVPHTDPQVVTAASITYGTHSPHHGCLPVYFELHSCEPACHMHSNTQPQQQHTGPLPPRAWHTRLVCPQTCWSCVDSSDNNQPTLPAHAHPHTSQGPRQPHAISLP
jgi:hypothetical protein